MGSDAVREGAYVKGLRALDKAVSLFPQLVLAYARRAEAHAELDDQEAAKDRLLHVARLVPNEARLPRVERLRIQAVRALVVRDVDSAVSLYRELVDLVSDESRAWLDLGRAQEAAGLRLAAVESYRTGDGTGPQLSGGVSAPSDRAQSRGKGARGAGRVCGSRAALSRLLQPGRGDRCVWARPVLRLHGAARPGAEGSRARSGPGGCLRVNQSASPHRARPE